MKVCAQPQNGFCKIILSGYKCHSFALDRFLPLPLCAFRQCAYGPCIGLCRTCSSGVRDSDGFQGFYSNLFTGVCPVLDLKALNALVVRVHDGIHLLGGGLPQPRGVSGPYRHQGRLPAQYHLQGESVFPTLYHQERAFSVCSSAL